LETTRSSIVVLVFALLAVAFIATVSVLTGGAIANLFAR
jgi:hypothetical protein